jgi:WD40 repeat protein
MLRFSLPLTIVASALLVSASAGQQPPAATDLHGDPLPADALARWGTIRWRHGSPILFVAFLPGGKSVLSAGEDGVLHVWEYPSGKELRHFGVDNAGQPGKGGVVVLGRGRGVPVALSRDGKIVAVCGADGAVRVYNVADGGQLTAIPLDLGNGRNGLVTALALAPDGQQLALFDLVGNVHLYNWPAGVDKLRTLPAGKSGAGSISAISQVAYSPDGKFLVSAEPAVINNQVGQRIRVFDPAAGKEIWAVEDAVLSAVFALAVSPDSKTLAYTRADGSLVVVEAATGKEMRSWKHNLRGALQLAFAPDGGRLYGRGLTTQVAVAWDVATGKELQRLGQEPVRPGLGGPARAASTAAMALSSDGKLLVLAGAENRLQFFDVATGKEVGPGAGNSSPLVALSFTADGKHVVARAGDGAFHRWEAATGKEPAAPPARTLPLLAVSPDGRWLATQGPAGVVLVDTATGKETGTIAADGRDLAGNVLFAPDGNTLTVRFAQDNKIGLYDLPGGKLRHNLPVAAAGNTGGGGRLQPGRGLLFFAADGKTLAGFADTTTLALWDTRTGKRVGAMKVTATNALQSGAFSPDGRCVALDFADGSVALLEVATGQDRLSLTTAVPGAGKKDRPVLPGGNRLPPTEGSRVAFTPDGRLLVQAGIDRLVHVWDAATGKELKTFKGHVGPLTCLAVAPDGKTAVSASSDTTALVWSLAGITPAPAPARALGADDCEDRWRALLVGKARLAFLAIRELAGSPKEAVVLIKEQVKPAAPLDVKRVEALIADLDSNQYKLRQNAFAELLKLDERIVPAVEKALAAGPPLETKQRLEALHRQFSGIDMQGERLRAYRAVEVLERIGTPEACALLQTLADGAPGALVTSSAAAALERLEVSRK